MPQTIGKFRKLFDRQQKYKIFIIVLLMVAGAFLETLGVSLVVPLITAILDESFFQTNAIAKSICLFFGIESARYFIILVLLLLMLIFIIKDLFLYFEYYVQQRFIFNTRILVQKKLMKSFLHRPYEYFIQQTTGDIQKVLINDVNLTFVLLNNVMTLFTEMVVCCIMLCAIVAVDMVMAVFACIILMTEVFVIAKKVKPTMLRSGKESRAANGQMNKWIIQSVEGIKEIKVAQNHNFFVENYAKYAAKFAKIEQKNQQMSNAPRLIIEAATISSMLGLMVTLLLLGKETSELFPQLCAFAVAAVRLLPSANRISVAINSLPLYKANLDALIESMEYVKRWEKEQKTESGEKSRTELSLRDICALSNITFSYAGANEKVLEHVNMTIPVGKSIGIVGVSGAGKTTAVDLLLGLLTPQEGKVLSDGKNIMDNYDKWLSHLSYIPQTIYLLDDTIAANVTFGRGKGAAEEEQIWKALGEAHLEEFVRSMPEGIESKIGERGMRLSGGQRQRIGIARALYTDPELLIFDEATSALDNETESAIMESINALRGKKTIIIIAHRLSTIQGCDIVYRVENKNIIREK